jgi:hypothetical protein
MHICPATGGFILQHVNTPQHLRTLPAPHSLADLKVVAEEDVFNCLSRKPAAVTGLAL